MATSAHSRLAYAAGTSLLALVFFSACDSANKPDTSTPTDGGATVTATPGAADGYASQGGMWMPTQMTEHAEVLKKLGLAFEPDALTDPTAFPLGAVVSLGFCSGSFVSPDGLIVTNHHCAVPVALQYNSTPEKNLLQDGYLAKDRTEELWAGPSQRIYVTTSFTDVTDDILAGTADIEDPKARYEAIEKAQNDRVAACEAANADTRCVVRGFFEGAQFFEIQQLELRDIRLVYAPHAGVGVYGGEIDNWRWPRHTGDFTFLRAYVGKDGKPADYSKDNVPFNPPHHLKVATGDLDPGDLVMVAGYPGRTNRLKTSDEVQAAVSSYYPYAIERYEERIATVEALAKDDKDLAIKMNRSLRGWNNGLTNNRGMLEGLSKGGLGEQKKAEEKAMREWIAQDPARQAKYGAVLDEIAKLNAAERATVNTDRAHYEIMSGSTLLGRAQYLVELARERSKKAEDRKPGYSKKELAETRKRLEGGDRTYAEKADQALFALALERAARLPEKEQPRALGIVVGETADEAAIDAAVTKLYKKSKLGDTKAFLKLFDSIDEKKLKKSKDPFIQLALELEPINDELTDRQKAHEGAMAALRPTYVAAVREFSDGPVAPDANGTLRVTFGTVRGYAPTPEADTYTPFTTVSGMMAKNKDAEPFDVPDDVVAAVEAGKWGPYVDEEVGEVPVDFLADLDITGGNSGSACINARGELVGLAFDGNYEAMASDWLFMPEITRSIQVDFRYVMWLMDAVDGADHLLEEMGVTPSI